MRTYSSGMPSCRRGIAAFSKRVPNGNLPFIDKNEVGVPGALACRVGIHSLGFAARVGWFGIRAILEKDPRRPLRHRFKENA